MSTFTLIETIPNDLRITTKNSTADTLISLINNAKQDIYVTVMYWSLLACPPKNLTDLEKTPIPYNTTCPVDPTFNFEDLQKLGSDKGREMFIAFRNALIRGVNLNFISGRGFGGVSEDKLLQKLSQTLNTKGKINLFDINTLEWWNGGIFHQKIWAFDPNSNTNAIYIGSANMDWKSLSQVKEIGIVVNNNSDISQDVLKYWNTWKQFSQLDPKKYITTILDPDFGIQRQVTCWNPKVVPPCPIPIDGSSKYNMLHQLKTNINNKISDVFITGCPISLCMSDKSLPRTYDEDGIIYSMKTAKKTICISVMDFVPSSIYESKNQIWWSKFFDPILNAVITRGLNVKILVSNWAYSSHIQKQYLLALANMSSVCKVAQNDANWSGGAGTGTTCPKSAPCFPGKISCGNLEIKEFTMPGWNKTQGKNPQYTSHSRVNHTKYMVTDNRANIGTSNWTWGYFYNTAGSSFNTDNTDIVSNLQDIFDRDWNSSYTNSINYKNSNSNVLYILLIIMIVIIVILLIFKKN